MIVVVIKCEDLLDTYFASSIALRAFPVLSHLVLTTDIL